MLSNKKDKIFSRSLEQADKSDMLFKHGCVATCGGKIIACGHNFHQECLYTPTTPSPLIDYHIMSFQTDRQRSVHTLT